MEFPAVELGRIVDTEVFLGQDQDVTFSRVKFAFPLQYKNENVEWAVEYMSPEFRREVWCRHENLRVTYMLICGL